VQTFPANPLIDNGRGIENTPNPRRRVSYGGNLATLVADICDRHGLLLTRPPAAAQPAGPAPILPSTVRPGTGPP